MNESSNEPAESASEAGTDRSRRNFLLLVPVAFITGGVATVAAAAFRFLRPPGRKSPSWTDVAPLAELTGDQPIIRAVKAEQESGWATTSEEHFVYVLPRQNHQVVSAVCPHEGCEVIWRADAKVFACPCHDSNFAADGARLTGPTRRGLDPLPSRVQNGVLQVQYEFFENNTEERIARV